MDFSYFGVDGEQYFAPLKSPLKFNQPFIFRLVRRSRNYFRQALYEKNSQEEPTSGKEEFCIVLSSLLYYAGCALSKSARALV